MTLHTPLFAQNGSYPAREIRTIFDLCPGVGPVELGHLRVSQRAGGANMSVDVAAGLAIIPAAVSSRGRYLCRSDATVNVALDAAPGAGNSRVDLVVAKVADVEYGDPADEWTIVAIPGAPGPVPVAPSVPAGSIPLAQVRVNAEVSAVTDGNITERRAFATPVLYAPNGAVEIGGFDGQIVVDEHGHLEVYASGAWWTQPRQGQFGGGQTDVSMALSGSEQTGGTVTIPQPTGPVTVSAHFHGRCAGNGSYGEARVDISFDGGTTWTPGATGRAAFAAADNVPVALSSGCVATGIPTGQVRARVRVRRSGGTTAEIAGAVMATVQPAGF